MAPDARTEALQRQGDVHVADQPQLQLGVPAHDVLDGRLDREPVEVVCLGTAEVAHARRARPPGPAQGTVGDLAQQQSHPVVEAADGQPGDRSGMATEGAGAADVDVAGLHRRAVAVNALQPQGGLVGRQELEGRNLGGDVGIEDEVVDVEERGRASASERVDQLQHLDGGRHPVEDDRLGPGGQGRQSGSR